MHAMPLTSLFARLRWVLAVAALAAGSAHAQNFLWEVTALANRAYLFGTLHAGRKDWYPLPRAVEEALADSQVLVVEADISDPKALAASGEAMVYKPPDSLRRHVSPADYARLLKLLPRYRIPESDVQHMKPFMAVSLLVFSEWARQGYVPQLGVDAYLLARAHANKMPVVELEGVENQMRMMDSLTDAESRTLFSGTLGALESGLTAEQIRGMVNAWQVGDPALMLEVARRYNERVQGAAAFEEKFVWSHHDAMIAKIEGYLNDSAARHFIAVGALHLAGPRGLVEQLRARGYVVRQIFVDPRGGKPK
jgi:uncharacterized protein